MLPSAICFTISPFAKVVVTYAIGCSWCKKSSGKTVSKKSRGSGSQVGSGSLYSSTTGTKSFLFLFLAFKAYAYLIASSLAAISSGVGFGGSILINL